MANFVYQFYTSNLDFLKEQHEKLLAEQAAAIEAAKQQEEPMEVTTEVNFKIIDNFNLLFLAGTTGATNRATARHYSAAAKTSWC